MEESQSNPTRGDDRSLKTAESLRALREQADQTLESHRNRVSEIEVRLSEQIQRITEELSREQLADQESLAASADQAALLEQLQQAVAAKETEIEAVLEELTAQSLNYDSQLAERDEELEQVLELSEEESQQRELLEQQLAAAQKELENLNAEQCNECEQLRAELQIVAQQLQEREEQFSSIQEQHQAQQADLEASQQEAQSSQEEVLSAQEQHQQVAAMLSEAEQRIAELSQYEENDQQLEQTLRKFELALADVHKLKRENAELHEELLSRPAADDQESPELVSLRAERDALAERISELESAPTPTETAEGQQELEDLQRRFELAVDDVRQLKQTNAALEEKLEASSTNTIVHTDTGPLDWQAQKAQLLAELDAEDQGQIDEQRHEARATIEGTISITDRVVAEKDSLLSEQEAELVALRSQLENRPTGPATDELRSQIAAEILGDDEAVRTELAKLQQQQEQLNDKLREAELEISVQRATLAREQAALEEKLSQLPDTTNDDEDLAANKPRRRWLSALGIKDEENAS